MREIKRPTIPGYENFPLQENSVKLSFVGPKTYHPGYLQERESVWDQAIKQGKKIWNGIVYTIDAISPEGMGLNLSIGLCEYKDIFFKQTRGHELLLNQYGEDSIQEHIVVACLPQNEKGELVLGVRGEESTEYLDLIGGTLNADEMDVTNFSDFGTFLGKEFREEVGQDVSNDNFELFCVNRQGGKYEFIYTFRFNSTEMKFVPADDEFTRFQLFSSKELLTTSLAKDGTVIALEKHLR